MTPLRQRFIEDLQLRNYAPKTIVAYVHQVRGLAHHFKLSPDRLDDDQIRRYLLHLLHDKHAAETSYNQAVAALRFFYEVSSPSGTVVRRLPYGKQSKRLPAVRSPQLAALSRCLAQLPQLRSLLPDCRDLLGFVGHAVPRHPRHSLRRCPLCVNFATTLDPGRHADPDRVQPARLLSAPRPHRTVGEPLGSVPSPAQHVWGLLQASPPLHSGHHALPDAPPHPIPPLLGIAPDE